MRRVGIFGWGVVAPRSPHIDAFARNLESSESWLEPFGGFGPDNFLVGRPEFRFEDYRDWVIQRFKPNRFSQLESKMGQPIQFAIGSFIQALGQNPGLEQELQKLGRRAHVYIGTGLGDLGVQYESSLGLYRAQRHWDRFWAKAERNSARRAWLEGRRLSRRGAGGAPPADHARGAAGARQRFRGRPRHGRGRVVELLEPPQPGAAAIPRRAERNRVAGGRRRRRDPASWRR